MSPVLTGDIAACAAVRAFWVAFCVGVFEEESMPLPAPAQPASVNEAAIAQTNEERMTSNLSAYDEVMWRLGAVASKYKRVFARTHEPVVSRL
jgi:hypothetical protein